MSHDTPPKSGARQRSTREQDPARKRELILEEALTLFAEKGYEATSITEIGERLGMAHGTFYRYFKNKHDVFIDVINLVMRRIATLSQFRDPYAANSIEDYQTQLEGIADAVIAFNQEDPRIGRLVFHAAAAAGEDVRRTLEGSFVVTTLLARHYLKNGKDKGFLRTDIDEEVMSKLLMAMVYEACRDLTRTPSPDYAFERWLRTIVDFIIKGLGSARKPPAA